MTKFDINITDEQAAMEIDPQCLRDTVTFVLKSFDIKQAIVSIAVVDSPTIQRLKKEFFDMDVVTDVISFDLSDEQPEDVDAESDLPSSVSIEWEIVVNAQLAFELAKSKKEIALAEINLYVVHGLLHQLGYDDQTPQQSAEMHEKEDQLLEQLGYGKVFNRKG